MRSETGAEIVDLDQADSGRGLFSALDHGVGAGGKGDDERGFEIVLRRESGGCDLILLVIFPVVVAAMMMRRWSRRTGRSSDRPARHHPGIGERRTEPANEHPSSFRCR